MSAPQAKFALEFPQGYILYADNGVFYQPYNSTIGYMVYGDRKELYGKNAIVVSANRETGGGDYAVVHEFKNGALADARLIQRNTTLEGKLADAATLEQINADLAAGTLTLRRPQDGRPPSLYNVAQFPDGRLLLQVHGADRELYLGRPGNFEKLDAVNTVQGGGSMYYKMSDGTQIALPYGLGGPGYNDVPKFGDQELVYLHTRPGDDLAKFGLHFPPAPPYLDPFSPGQLPEPKPGFKPPQP
ncbi:MAG TPA: hypothetical protein VEF76_01690 [Patescibacteria group bacterium]|nr:hypothetical protein [Patescibacteria group bacterium]